MAHAYTTRLASFSLHTAADERWPLDSKHSVTPKDLAMAGFSHAPLKEGQDNAVCFLCDKSLGGWEEGDKAVNEHLNHTIKKGNVKKACPFAVLQSGGHRILEVGLKEGKDLVKMRKDTFGKKVNGWWLHEGRRGWPTPDKLAHAGFHLNAQREGSDDVMCCWCGLQLNGWAKGDVPVDEHKANSPSCYFFDQSRPYTGPNSTVVVTSVSEATIKARSGKKKSAETIPDDEGEDDWQQLLPSQEQSQPTKSGESSKSAQHDVKSQASAVSSTTRGRAKKVIDIESSDDQSDVENTSKSIQTGAQLAKAASISRSTRSNQIKSIASSLEPPAPSFALPNSVSSQDVAALLGVAPVHHPLNDSMRTTRSGRVTSLQQSASKGNLTTSPKNAPQTAPLPKQKARNYQEETGPAGILHVLAPLSAPAPRVQAAKSTKAAKATIKRVDDVRDTEISPAVQASMAQAIAAAKGAGAQPTPTKFDEPQEATTAPDQLTNESPLPTGGMDPRLFCVTPISHRLQPSPVPTQTPTDLAMADVENNVESAEASLEYVDASAVIPDAYNATDAEGDVSMAVEEAPTAAVVSTAQSLFGSLSAASPIKAIHDFFRPPTSPVAAHKSPVASPVPMEAVDTNLSPIKRVAVQRPVSPVSVHTTLPAIREEEGSASPIEHRPMIALGAKGKGKFGGKNSLLVVAQPAQQEKSPLTESSRTIVPYTMVGYTQEELQMPLADLCKMIMDETMIDTERQLRAKQADFRQKIEDARRRMREVGVQLK